MLAALKKLICGRINVTKKQQLNQSKKCLNTKIVKVLVLKGEKTERKNSQKQKNIKNETKEGRKSKKVKSRKQNIQKERNIKY